VSVWNGPEYQRRRWNASADGLMTPSVPSLAQNRARPISSVPRTWKWREQRFF
jgi:hypothetical protein